MTNILAFSAPHSMSIPVLIIIGVVGLGILVFEVWMFVALLQNTEIDETRKTLWIIGMLLVHPFVAIAYYLTDYKKINY